MAEPLLQVREITKAYKKLRVFERFSLTVDRGEIFGLLGVNGAGKTTLFKSILGLVKTSAGEVLFDGKTLLPETVQEKIGYLPEFFLPPGELNAGELLQLMGFGESVPAGRIRSLFERTELDPGKRIADYSRGMIQRLGLAIALLKNPEFIMLDEPALGLDPVAQQKMLSWLKEFNGEGRTILFSSHYLFHVEQLCHRIAIMHHGGIRFVGPTAEFLEKHRTDSLEEAFLKEVGYDA